MCCSMVASARSPVTTRSKPVLVSPSASSVYPEGSLTSPPETNVQTTHVSAGGATAVELTVKVPGTYSIVDHSLGRMEKGAAAQIVVDGPDQPEIFQSIKPGSGGSGGH